jgi:hypothetical protein
VGAWEEDGQVLFPPGQQNCQRTGQYFQDLLTLTITDGLVTISDSRLATRAIATTSRGRQFHVLGENGQVEVLSVGGWKVRRSKKTFAPETWLVQRSICTAT